ncbi:glycosyltransferase [Methylobacterium oxalidis]|uniref:glycosyltransferase n=1 Tax=Methylobacterium oxalidis TaxID=944322 RepID=UPI003315DC9B
MAMNGLIVSTVLPGRARSGGSLVTHRVVEELRSMGCATTVIGYAHDDEPVSPSEINVERRIVETRRVPFSALCWGAASLVHGKPYIAQKFISSAYIQRLQELLRIAPWDFVVIDHAQMAWALPHLRCYPTFHLSHNAESRLYADLARKRVGPARWVYERETRLIEAAERQLAQDCDEIWTLSTADAQYFRDLGARAVRNLSIPVAIHTSSAQKDRRTDVAILGSWTWEANRVGLDWYVREVHPRLPSDLKVEIAGRGAEDLAGTASNLSVCGPVDDAAAFLSGASCIAVPSIAGAGIQIKTLDAIATGKPVVATPVAMRGIEAPPDSVTVVESPAAFAAALVAQCQHAGEWADAGIRWSQARQQAFSTELRESVHRIISFESGALIAAH